MNTTVNALGAGAANMTYAALLAKLYSGGDDVESRIGPTKELLGGQYSFLPGTMVKRGGLNNKIGWVELLMLVNGTFDKGLIAKVAPRAQLNLFTNQSAYGPRIGHQLENVVAALANPDSNSRQAVIILPRAEEAGTGNMPCTTSLQFLRRGNTVHTIVNMRSWDVIKGLPYDIMMFGGLALAICHMLDTQPGVCTVTAGSMHVYTADMVDGRVFHDTTDCFSFDARMPRLVTHGEVGSVVDGWRHHCTHALSLAPWDTEASPGRPHFIDLEKG